MKKIDTPPRLKELYKWRKLPVERDRIMVEAVSNPILQLIRRVVEKQHLRELTDQELLWRFHDRHDEAAFHALLRRHGPVVLDVCRSVLGKEADAEDAFQATFLILARKAGSIRKAGSLGSWLHGVAYRTALKGRAQSVTRHKHEARVPIRQATAADDLSWREVRQVIHEELSGLPERYRAPLVLCYLEGVTQEAAAVRLGLAKGTLRERLRRGQALLKVRLVRRGLGPSVLLAAAAWPATTASADVPLAVVVSSVKAAGRFAAGQAAATIASAKVAALTEGVLKTMFLTKLKVALATLALLALVGTGGGALALQKRAVEGGETPPQDPKQAAARPVERESAGPATWKIGPTLPGTDDRVWRVAFSPEGKWLAASGSDKNVVVWDVAKREAVHKFPHAGNVNAIAFTPHGKTLITASGNEGEDHLIQLWDLETGKEQGLLKGYADLAHSLSFSRDGKVLISVHSSVDFRQQLDTGLVSFWDLEAKKKIADLKCDRVHTALLSHDGKKLVTADSNGTVKLWDVGEKFAATRETVLAQGLVCGLHVSPDRKTFVIAPVASDGPSIDLVDFATGKTLQSFDHKEVYEKRDVAFSPDGKTLATACWSRTKKGGVEEMGGEVKFWDVATGKEKQSLREKFGPVNGLAFAPHGRTLVVCLFHQENLKLRVDHAAKGGFGFEQPANGYRGAVVLCELK